jgi:hypothetical protein
MTLSVLDNSTLGSDASVYLGATLLFKIKQRSCVSGAPIHVASSNNEFIIGGECLSDDLA